MRTTANLTKAPKIRLNDRIAVFGMTGSGKSVLAHYLYNTITAKLPVEKEDPETKERWIEPGFWKICIDVTDSVNLPQALTFYDPYQIPWDQAAALRFVPDIDELEAQINALYAEVILHGSCWVWLDEANEVSSAHKTIPGLRKVLLQGRKFQVGNLSATPRPADISKSIYTQSEHHFIFNIIDEGDRRRIASNIGLALKDFDVLMASLPMHGYLWFSVRDQAIFEVPPLPRDIVRILEGEV